jgi:hypothetical protein
MVEASIALPLVFFIVFVGADLLRVAYNAVAIQFLAARSLRSAVLTDRRVTTAAEGEQRAAQIQNEIVRLAEKYGIRVQPDAIKICVGATETCDRNNAGGADELVTVTIRHRVNTLVGMMLPREFTLVGQVVGRNEYYFQ